MRDAPRETGRASRRRGSTAGIFPAEKVRANVECRWSPGGAPSRGKRAKERDPRRSARVRPAWRFHNTGRKRFRRLARTLRGHRPALDALSARFPGRENVAPRCDECSPARKPPHRKRRWRAFTPETPSKKPCGAMDTPVHDSNRPNEPPMRDGIPRPRLLSRGRRLATFPAPLEKKRRPPTPGPGPVSRAAASSHALSPALRPLRPRKASRQANRAVSSASLRSNDPPRSASPRLMVQRRMAQTTTSPARCSAKPKPDISRSFV